MGPSSYHDLVSRNQGIIDAQDQEILRTATIAVAGCGADGGSPSVSLARLGVRNFRLADPDTFDYSNINRQEGAFYSTAGKSKAAVIADIIRDIDPTSNVQTFEEGINEGNIEDFLKGADLFLEEIDYRKPEYTSLAHSTAFRLNIPILTVVSVGWNSFLFYFKPGETTYQEYVGEFGLQAYAPEIPDYFPPELVQEVLEEKREIPAIDPAVRMATALASSFSYFLLTKKREILPVPHYYSAGDLFLKSANLLTSK